MQISHDERAGGDRDADDRIDRNGKDTDADDRDDRDSKDG